MDQASIFRVIVPSHEPFADVLDLWQVSVDAEAFAYAGELPGMVWRADLPRDPQEATRALNQHAHVLRQTESALSAAGQLLDDDLRQVAAQRATQVSFEMEAGGMSGRQAVLAFGLNYDPQQVAYSRMVDVLNLDDTIATVGRFASQVRRLVEQFALVESVHGGRRSGLTRVNWLGDAQTWWMPDSPSTAVAHHSQLLMQALVTRRNWMRFLLQLSGGAVKVGMAMASGPFAPAAIWTAFNYLRKVVEQYHRLAEPAGE